MSILHAPVPARAGEAELLGVEQVGMRLLADGDPDDPHSVSAVRTTMARGMDGPPPHTHVTGPETFFMVEGRLHVLLGTETTTLEAGDLLVVPPHTAHAFATPDDSGADFLFFMPGIARFDYFRLGVKVHRGEESMQAMLATQDRYDNHLTDSPEWRRFREAK